MRALKFVLGLAVCGAFSVLPAPALSSSISGTVTAEGGGAIQGIEVCSRANPYAFEDTCVETNASGAYKVDDLPGGSYYLAFLSHRNHLNYVSESYNDKLAFLGDGDLLSLGAGQNLTGIDAELEKGGVVTGTVTDADTLGPAAGVWVCIESFDFSIPFGICLRAGADGKYEVNGVPTGEYRVSFDGENDVNYLRQFYNGAESFPSATPVDVTAGSTTSGINAALYPGAQLFGRVTEAGTGAPLEGIAVCLFDYLHAPSPEYLDRCARTDAAGNYAMRSLRAGAFKVVFLEDGFGPLVPGLFDNQWWNGVSSASEATPISFAPPQSVTGIDAQLVNLLPKPKPDPIQVTILPTPKPPPKKCRKGLHKKKVKGEVRCVRKHQRRGGKQRGRVGR